MKRKLPKEVFIERVNKVKSARDRFIKETEDRWGEVVWALSQEMAISEEEVERILDTYVDNDEPWESYSGLDL